MKNMFLITLLATFLQAQTITIAVAANVSYAIEELQSAFKKENPNIEIKTILGSSGKLTAQIKHGAPFGLFMSANMKYPNALYEDGVAITEPVVYAYGSLAYVSLVQRDFSKPIKLLQNAEIKKIAIANPKTAPYGQATLEAFHNAKVYKSLKSKLIYGESISQTLSYALKAADIGIVAKSSLYSKTMSHFIEHKHWESISTKLYTPIKQGIVLLKHAKNNSSYKLFYDFILSEQGKKILLKYGYQI